MHPVAREGRAIAPTVPSLDPPLANKHFGGMYSIAFAVVVRHSLSELDINSIPGGDVFGYSSAWNTSNQCQGNPQYPQR